jgi:hypothetical protein
MTMDLYGYMIDANLWQAASSAAVLAALASGPEPVFQLPLEAARPAQPLAGNAARVAHRLPPGRRFS